MYSTAAVSFTQKPYFKHISKKSVPQNALITRRNASQDSKKESSNKLYVFYEGITQ
jgi:hypothetical protein